MFLPRSGSASSKVAFSSILLYFRLLDNLIKKELRTKYAGSVIGLFWNVIHPLVLFILYYFLCVFIFRLKLRSVEYGYAEFLFCGLWPWITFSEALSGCTSVFVNNASIIKKVMFPVELLVLTIAGVSAIQLLAGLGIFLVYLAWLGKLSVNILWFPAALALQLLLTVSLGLLCGALNVFWRDLQQVIIVLLNIWFYVTPIIYSVEMIPVRFRVLFYCNPFYYVVAFYRWTFLGMEGLSGGWFVLVCGGFFLFGVVAFKITGVLKKDFGVFL